MKRLFVGLIVSVFLLLIVFLLGPRANIKFSEPQINLTDDLEAYIRTAESEFDDIVEGTAKSIVWKDSDAKSKTEYAIVYLHGFGATLPETRPLADMVARELGCNLFYTRLRGHGRGSEAFSQSTAGEWMEDAYEALEIGRRLGERVVLMGCSTGATLATWLAHYEQGSGIAAVVMVSPNFGPKDPNAKFLTYPWAKVLVPKIMGETYAWTSPNEKVMKYYTTRHKMSALFEMMALVKRVNGLDYKNFDTPMLAVFSPDDQVVDQQKTIELMARVASRERELFEVKHSGDPQNHLIVGDIWSPDNNDEIKDVVVNFVRKIERSSSVE